MTRFAFISYRPGVYAKLYPMLITNQHYEFKIFTYKLFASSTDLHDYGKCINVSQGKYIWEKLSSKTHLSL